MTKYGKIYIEASSIEEAERDLEMIKALAKAGAVKGQGSSALGMASAEIVGKPTAPTKCGCACKCHRDCGCDWDYEDEDEISLLDRVTAIVEDIAFGCIDPDEGAEMLYNLVMGD
jgi:hypothetical protein